MVRLAASSREGGTVGGPGVDGAPPPPPGPDGVGSNRKSAYPSTPGGWDRKASGGPVVPSSGGTAGAHPGPPPPPSGGQHRGGGRGTNTTTVRRTPGPPGPGARGRKTPGAGQPARRTPGPPSARKAGATVSFRMLWRRRFCAARSASAGRDRPGGVGRPGAFISSTAVRETGPGKRIRDGRSRSEGEGSVRRAEPSSSAGTRTP